jgi:type I restriction enzyme S subunit
METRIVCLGDISTANVSSITTKHSGSLSYFDTSSVVDGSFNEPVKYSSLEGVPSRARRKAYVGDTVISTVRPKLRHFGFLSEMPNDAVYSTGFTVLHPKTDMVLPYFLYLLVTANNILDELQQIGETTTTAYPSVKPSDILNMRVSLPALREQRTIVEVVKTIDDKIKLNQQINKNLLRMIDCMFNKLYWSSGCVQAANKVMLSSLVRTKTKTFNPHKTDEVVVNHFSMPSFDATHFPVVEAVANIKSNKNIVESLSILVSKMNPDVKRVWLPNTSTDLLNVVSTEFLTFNAETPDMQAFIYAVVNSKNYQQFLVANTTGSTNSRQRVLPKTAYSYEIPYDEELAQKLGSELTGFVDLIKLNKEQNQRLTQLRNLLLPKLLSGEIDLSNIESVINNG